MPDPIGEPLVDPLGGQLGDLLAKSEITEVLMRYARGVDRRDFELVAGCYHPDAVDDHGAFRGPVDEFIPWVKIALARFDSTMHFIGNVLIEVDEADRDLASVESYCIAYHRLAGRDQDSIAGFRYVDRFARRDGSWRIAHRLIVVEWNRLDDVHSLGFGNGYETAKPWPEDAVYRR